MLKKIQDPEITFSPPPVLQIASCQSARYKIKKGEEEDGVRGEKENGENDADCKSGEYRR
jgi:hypothetical protein